MGVLDFLKEHVLFRHLDEQKLQDLARAFREKTYKKGELLIEQGAEDHRFFVLMDGVVAIVLKVDRDKLEVVANFREKGDFFGEVGAMYHVPRTASVIALTDVRAIFLEGEDFERLLYSDPKIREQLQQVVDERLIASEAHLERHRTTLHEILFGREFS